MNDLSILQSYMLCAVNGGGYITGLASINTEKQACFVAAGLLELRMSHCIQFDGTQLRAIAPLPEEKSYLSPLYSLLMGREEVPATEILVACLPSFLDILGGFFSQPPSNLLPVLVDTVGASLVELDLIERTIFSSLRGRTGYLPRREAVRSVIEVLRAELLEDGPVTEESAALAILLDQAGYLAPFFSNFERRELEQKVRQLQDSPDGRFILELVAFSRR